MPRVMTMNKDYQTAPSAPLDLTTTPRKSTGSRTPDYRIWEKDARVTGGSPAPPACTGTGSSETHCPSARAAPGAEASASRKRPADSSSSKLPFRKRPITGVPESQRPLPDPPVSRDRFSPAEDTNCTLPECLPVRPDGGRLVVAPVTPRQVQGAPIQVKYQLPPMDYHNYGHYPVYLPPVSRLQYLMVPQNDNLLAGISLATRQDEDGDTALHIAVVQGELAMTLNLIEMLVWAHKDLDIYNNLRQTPLHLAVITKQAKIVEALLRARADPAALDRHGQTALHLCCEYNQRDCLSVLLSFSSSSACLEIRNFEGLRPLHLAVLQGHQTLAKMLLDAGADINAMDIKSGQSPLMLAVENNNKDMVDFLIENGCDVNSQSYSGNTALHIACGRGQGETVRLLLKSGADSSLKNYHNDTPVMVAKNKKIADVLRGRGAKQIRVQDQHSMSVSPHGSNSMQNGSPSPNHSIGSSPSTTPHTFHHSACHSPKTQPAFHQLY